MIDKNEIIILDDVIPKVQQDKIESLLLGHRTSWVYMHDIALSKEDMARNGITQRTPGMASYFNDELIKYHNKFCLLYTSPSPRDRTRSRMPSSA